MTDECDVERLTPASSAAAASKWSPEEVGEWVATELSFPQYKMCFVQNFVDGEKLKYVDASKLPEMGVTDWEHVKQIAAAIRMRLQLSEPNAKRSVADMAFQTH